ncbi:MAG: hypothetical protein MAG581_00027 [Deltaproteobacteria bacterium]|jgi:hypothetical protein|nr:hypothetical protein [Deltaproteobacteria bacterium]
MDLPLSQIIMFFTENYFIVFPLLVVLSLVLALLVWKQLRLGWSIYFSKRRLIEQLIEK